MRDIIQPGSVRVETSEEHPELSWEAGEPYNPSDQPVSQREVSGLIPANDEGSLMERQSQDPHQIWMRKPPQVFRSLYFDGDVRKIRSIEEQQYSLFIKASLKQYQKYPKQTGKNAHDAEKECEVLQAEEVHKLQCVSF